jgi:antitoxin component YwqK of YwqJK toxin-antitoxin module
MVIQQIISMKKLALLLLVLSFGKAYAQRNDDYNDRSNNNSSTRGNVYKTKSTNDDDFTQVRIIDTTQEIRADIEPYKSEPKIKNDRYYFWYLNKVIHSTQGGYSGTLLNGHYVAFYPDKNLKEEGNFNRGLKDGEWKTWNRKGDLTAVTNWNDGVQLNDNQQSVWKKIPFFNKKDDQTQPAKTTDSN